MPVSQLTISTCMAPNIDFFCRDLAAYLSERLSIPARAVLDVSWQKREKLLDDGEIDLCWICGLPYIWKADRDPGSIVPLVAPVMAGIRYGNLPIYFSDVVVHRDSPFLHFEDLRNASWAYNEPGSHSGYGVVRYSLARKGLNLDYFDRVIESGAHQVSLDMILRREVDASAIDSTVLEMELAQQPELSSQLRILATFGPSPIPPWVISRGTPAEIRETLLEILTRMDGDLVGKAILHQARMTRFVPVSDRDYDPIREMARLAFST